MLIQTDSTFVCVCVFGVCRLNPASLGSLTTSPSLWLALSVREGERGREGAGGTQGEIWKELQRKSRKKEKERAEQSSCGRSKAQQLPLSSPRKGLVPLSFIPLFTSLSSLWTLSPHLQNLPPSLFPTPLFPSLSFSKKLVYSATTCENQQLAPN